ncbi:MAG TPA: indolepyruvate oxidoreductase subunit beta family protein [Candidatus Acidoferrales bacterium]|jgi:indolepyruvate ferredoxin oxidoreductase beta subunit|nr:indolepyruvate oxidoreductase subunit beta family protein [Candidatus Acidoferrales bacterium]
MPVTQTPQPAAPEGPVAGVRTINIAILAMGGEGGGVLADWIVDMAEHSGYLAQTTSVPGVAQRTGATIYYVELFPEDAARNCGKDPVMALMPVPGEVDVVIASELMEAGRAITRGLVTPDRTTLIASTNRVYSMAEKTAMADGRVDASTLLKAGKDAARTFIGFDFARLAEENRSVISATLLGALAASGALPFIRKQFEEAIKSSGISVESSLKAFAAGLDAAGSSAPLEVAPAAPSVPRLGPALQELGARITAQFPAASHPIVTAGIERLADYQDVSYAAEYLDKLIPIKDLDRQFGHGDCTLLRETARYLALWMSYEDAIRVADLKTRRTRFERVQQEAHATSKQVLEIHEFLYPRVEEFADIMPAALGARILKSRWMQSLVNRFAGKGKILKTTSLAGFLQLYWVASLRPRRRRTLRFKREIAQIDQWLAHVKELVPVNYDLACEVAECPRLVKGYGETHERGSRNFELLMQALPVLRQQKNAASQLKSLREAALADDTGEKLAAALRELGLQQGARA